jgi:CRP-like cAMP-binding protein
MRGASRIFDDWLCLGMSTNSLIIPLLAKTELFARLAPDVLEACAESFRKTQFAKGETIFQRGDLGTCLYLVVEGRVRLAIATEEGRELSFRHAAAGDLFGEIAMLDGGARTADATALSAVKAYQLERNALHALWSRHTAISEQIVTFLCKRLRETSGQLESIALHPLHVRLARFLLVGLGDRKPPPNKRLPLDLGFSQGELALLLGASRPKINEALGTLESANAIGRTLDRIFCDPNKLAEIAQQGDH